LFICLFVCLFVCICSCGFTEQSLHSEPNPQPKKKRKVSTTCEYHIRICCESRQKQCTSATQHAPKRTC
jgi:hypothetical protein